MKTNTLVTGLLGIALACVAVSAPGAYADNGNMPHMGNSGTHPGQIKADLAGWPAIPAKAAETLMAKYGPPNEATSTMLVWLNNGPWKRTVLYRDEVSHQFPKSHTDFLEQVIDYRVPPDKFDDLAQYDGSVVANRTQGEISARCDKEENNWLALNLANDVITGRKSVDEARHFYAETIAAAMRGEKPAYTQGFQFTVVHGGTADPDSPVNP